ncbi:MAG: type VI secretion system protein TssA [Geminicoccaceae bacterium]
MAPIDLDRLLSPIAVDQPSGPSLEGDPDYLELEITATRHPETEVGGLVTPAREPDWAAVQQSTLGLLERSKDLQVAVYLTEALVQNHGLAGFREGLQLVQAFLDRYWDNLYPELDPSDCDGAASQRIMRLKGLGDRSRMVRALRQMPILEQPRHGSFSLSDVTAIGHDPNNGDEQGAQDAEMDAALQDAILSVDAGVLQTQLTDVIACLNGLDAIADLVDARSDVRESLGFEGVVETIDEFRGWIEEQLMAKGADTRALPDQGPSAAEAPCAEIPNDDPSAQHGSEERNPSPNPVAQGRGAPISTRDDALKTIDLLCHYFERHEPSSPVPLILRRAKRLVAKDFMTILKDLVPDGLDQMEKMVGERAAGEGAGD